MEFELRLFTDSDEVRGYVFIQTNFVTKYVYEKVSLQNKEKVNIVIQLDIEGMDLKNTYFCQCL